MVFHSRKYLDNATRQSFPSGRRRKKVFAYPASEWQNSFRVDDYGLEECLNLYEQHLSEYLKDEKRLDRFKLLLKAKEIGCFCRSGEKCHRDIVLKFLNKYR